MTHASQKKNAETAEEAFIKMKKEAAPSVTMIVWSAFPMEIIAQVVLSTTLVFKKK